jgi:hypothetical protein
MIIYDTFSSSSSSSSFLPLSLHSYEGRWFCHGLIPQRVFLGEREREIHVYDIARHDPLFA